MSDEDSATGDGGEQLPPESEISDHVTLPIGLDHEGQRYRHVVIDEMSGVDEELVSNKKKTGGNGSKAVSLVLCRCIQEIPGLLERKNNSDSLIDRELVRKMYQCDRDYLVSRIHMLAGNDETVMAGKCPRCDEVYEEDVLMSRLPVTEWPSDKAAEFEFELPVGYTVTDRGKSPVTHTKGTFKFPRGIEQEMVASIRDNPGLANSAMIASCIKGLGTVGTIDQEIAKGLKTRDRRHLMEEVKLKMPGMRQWKTHDCQGCGREFDLVVDMTAFFRGRTSSATK